MKWYNLWDECERRDGCRVGLKGLKINIIGSLKPYRIWDAGWGADRVLLLRLYPTSGAVPRYRWATRELEEENRHKLTIGLSDITEGRYYLAKPPGFQSEIPAERCILLERWPVFCCFPRRRKKPCT